jgi:predicted nucleotidyltransferase
MSITDSQLQAWAQAPSATKYITTRNRIEKALVEKFGSNIQVYLQGSYKNSTHVKAESDVDIIVEYTPAYYPGLHQLSEQERIKYHELHTNHDYTFAQFKTDVFDVLKNEFTPEEVEKGQKSIKVLKNDQRVNADVIACFTHQRFTSPSEFDPGAVGIHFFTDAGQEVINFPRQHHENGESKNHEDRTNGKYKDFVRIYKNLRYKLVDEGLLEDDEIASHFIECLVWNVPDGYFDGSDYPEILKAVTAQVWSDMKPENKPHDKYAYIHDLKWLFKGDSTYSPEKAQKFMTKVWEFAEF